MLYGAHSPSFLVSEPGVRVANISGSLSRCAACTGSSYAAGSWYHGCRVVAQQEATASSFVARYFFTSPTHESSA